MAKHDYQPHQKVIIFNDDPDLVPIKYKLPDPPPLKDIDGYGLKPEEQFFKYAHMPKRLRDIDKKKLSPIEKWADIKSRKDFYKEELDWIALQWERRNNGYWFFNNGTPTFITGLHYFYLNFWELDNGLPEYRYRDRMFFLFEKMCDEDDDCYGFIYIKHRREGATSKTACWNFEYVSKTKGAHGGIQSKTESDAKKVFLRHVTDGWRSMPFFFKPIHDGSEVVKNTLNFFAPGAKNAPEFGEDSLKSWIDYESSGEGAYDSQKLHRYHSDEAGKLKEADINERHAIILPTLKNIARGSKKKGKCIYTTTVGEMDKGGGARFKELADGSQSMYVDKYGKLQNGRDENNETSTGLYLLFISAADGLEEYDNEGKPFIDKYGNCDKVKAAQFVLNKRESLKKRKAKGKKKNTLAEYTRQFPLYYKECWRRTAKQCNFNEEIIQERLDDFVNGNPHITRGNFKWENNVPDTRVVFEVNNEGKFVVSWFFPRDEESNRVTMIDGYRYPSNVHAFVAGGDPTKFKQTEWGTRSHAAGAVFMKWNVAVDDPRKDVSEWKSNRLVCTYLNITRDKNEYVEDMIMMCHYYGCEMFPEINVPTLWDGFDDRGYKGFLFYQEDERTGLLKKTPGANTGVSMQQEIYNEVDSYILSHGRRECHEDFLIQCRDIEDDMGPYDLFVACGYALLGARSKRYNASQVSTAEYDNFFQQYEY